MAITTHRPVTVTYVGGLQKEYYFANSIVENLFDHLPGGIEANLAGSWKRKEGYIIGDRKLLEETELINLGNILFISKGHKRED